MFYSEAILSKKGPLARVWLAAHWEKKLTKSNIIQTDIQSAAKEISEEQHAPMALRLSGQLLLGVVRIYSRKARYLLEDCNDTLMKIKMTFRPGSNTDMSTLAVRSSQAQAAQLMLPDTLTELDLLMPQHNFDLDVDLDLNATFARAASQQRKDGDFSFSRSVEMPRGLGAGPLLELEEDNDAPILAETDSIQFGLDFGDDGAGDVTSVELGRDAAPERSLRDEFGMDTTLLKDLDMQDAPDADGADAQIGDVLGDISELPEITLEGGLDALDLPEISIDQPQAQSPVRAARQERTRKRRLVEDEVTEIPARAYAANLRNTSAITKRPRMLPSDPRLLSVRLAVAAGTLSSYLFMPCAVHPALADLLSPEFVRRVGDPARAASPSAADETRDDAGPAATSPILPPIDQEEDSLAALDIPDQLDDLGQLDFDEPAGALPADALDRADAREQSASQLSAADPANAVAAIRSALQTSAPASFDHITQDMSRANASEVFFQCLLAATRGTIKVDQATPYADITLTNAVPVAV
ncbi:sister chromatid cohesion protein 1 [Savitreella phatthalungensis]